MIADTAATAPSSRLLAVVVLRTLLAFGALLLVASALLLGLMAAAGLVLWARLRGRPAAAHLRWTTGAVSRRSWHPNAGEVVDVQVREVEPPAPR